MYWCTETGGVITVSNTMGGGGYYTVGNNAMYVQFKGFKGLVTVILRNFFKIIP